MKPHIVKFFQFLEDKEGKSVPLIAKLLNPDKFTFTFSKDELDVGGNLDLSNTNITILPDGLYVSADLNLMHCTSLKSLPNGLSVGGDLELDGCTALKTLPNGLYVGQFLRLTGCTSLESLPNGLQVTWNLYLNGCTSLTSLPDDLQVRWTLVLNGCTSLTSLPNDLQVGLNLELRRTPLAKMYSADEIRAMIESKGGYVEGRIYI